MALVTSKKMLEDALKGGYGIGAFNINGIESLQGIVEGARLERAPVIVQCFASMRDHIGAGYLRKAMEAAADTLETDICLHLDHGADFETCKSCVDGGFTSVMIDGSALPFEENVATTKKVVEYAHDKGVVVEGEIGALAGVEDGVSRDERSATFTSPEQAQEFVERTGVDSLAIAIGTSHGAYKFKGEAYLDFDRLTEIHQLIPEVPLVLHGASCVIPEELETCNAYGANIPGAQGVPEEMLLEATRRGICKVNTDTDIRLAMTAEVRKLLTEHPEEFDPHVYMGKAREEVVSVVRHKIRNVFGFPGKA